jgi:hypothetical protein
MRPGLAVTELAVSPLPGNPTAVFTVKRSVGDEFDAYIVVSFTNATLVGAAQLVNQGDGHTALLRLMLNKRHGLTWHGSQSL